MSTTTAISRFYVSRKLRQTYCLAIVQSFYAIACSQYVCRQPAQRIQYACRLLSAGALVFGGGHVVLPLLEQQTVATGWLTTDQFLTGYGAAQAVPGPMFTLATYLGAEIPTQLSVGWNALLTTLAIFIPGFFIITGHAALWQQLAHLRNAGAVVAGINAAVVGLLAAALYDPIFTEGVDHWLDLLIAFGGFFIIFVLKRSALWTVLFCVVTSVLIAIL